MDYNQETKQGISIVPPHDEKKILFPDPIRILLLNRHPDRFLRMWI